MEELSKKFYDGCDKISQAISEMNLENIPLIEKPKSFEPFPYMYVNADDILCQNGWAYPKELECKLEKDTLYKAYLSYDIGTHVMSIYYVEKIKPEKEKLIKFLEGKITELNIW